MRAFKQARISEEKAFSFIVNRLGSDGGYSFHPPLFGYEFLSSVSETFYALSSLELLERSFPNKNKTVSFLKSFDDQEVYANPMTAFYVLHSLFLLGEEFDATGVDKLRSFIERKSCAFQDVRSEFFSGDYDTGESPYRNAFYAAKTLVLCGRKIKESEVRWLYSCNKSFSDLACVFHVLSILSLSGFDVKKTREYRGFIEKCMVSPEGGFATSPASKPAFIESTYYGVFSCKLLGMHLGSQFKENTIRLLSSFQNSDGGFRRSPFGGVSALNFTYFALAALKELESNE